MKKYKLKISFIINIIIVLMVTFACIAMFTGFKFMHGHDLVLQVSKLGMFKFFTVDSNILMGIAALLFAYQEYKVIHKKRKEIDKKYYLLYFVATSSVSLTFVVTFAYLGNITEYGLKSLLMNSNLFFHFLVPVFSIINFILFLRTNKIKFKNVFYGLLPTFLYGIFYLTNVLIHMENGKVSPRYDFYWFVQNGINMSFIVIPVIFLISYIISLLLWILNKNKK